MKPTVTEPTYLVFDYETYSEADLKKCGAYEYSAHPSTEIICAAWRIGKLTELRNAVTRVWVPEHSNKFFGEFLSSLLNPNIILVAHNAYFEQCITRNVFAKKHMYSKEKEILAIPISRWRCTAARAAVMALPRRLEGACEALDLPFKKDMEGHRLMLKWCKPRKPTKNNPKTRQDDIAELRRLVQYCASDIAAEVELLLNTEPLNAKEQAIWELDQKINLNGIKVDRPLVKNVLSMIETVSADLDKKVLKLSGGVIGTARKRDAVLNHLAEGGLFLPDLTKGTVSETLENETLSGVQRGLLECRAAISKSSTAKYTAYEKRTRTDGRLRDILVYHAASTGRWGGSGVQLQNLPRPLIGDTIAAAEVLSKGDLETVELLYGNPMDVFSSCLRNVLVASEGKVLDVADYAAIELRVVFWMAKHEDGLQSLRNGDDLYIKLASKIFNKPKSEIDKGFERFIGKTAMLGCQYGLGHVRFSEMCKASGIEVSEDFAKLVIHTYRESNYPIPKLWSITERAAIEAVKNPSKKYSHNYVSWYMHGSFLVCALPSNRCLYYYKPTLKEGKTPWGENRLVLHHYGVDSLTKKWVLQKTWGGTLVENCVQAIARDIMADAMLRIDKTKLWDIVLSVHDELIAERDIYGGATLDRFCELMSTVPDWAPGCPISVEGYSSTRYKK